MSDQSQDGKSQGGVAPDCRPEAPAAPKPGGGPSFFLGVFDDHLRGLPLPEGTLVVGRSRSSHLQLHDDLLSRKHCALNLDRRRLELVDLNSSNGTFVNGERVASRQLDIDDIIELGRTVMVVYDGNAWRRGEGLMDLRNPIKAQKLIHRITENGRSFVDGVLEIGSPQNGVRAHKNLTRDERSFLRWLEGGASPLLPGLVSDYLTHKLVSLLVRNSKPVRAAFTTVLEEMMDPAFVGRHSSVASLRTAVEKRVREELGNLDEVADAERDLLEPSDHEATQEERFSASRLPTRDETPMPEVERDCPGGGDGQDA